MATAQRVDFRRHGDVILLTQKGFEIPSGVEMKASKLIHKGNNNSHVISQGTSLIGEKDGKKFLRITKAAVVSHEGGSATHDSKPLPVGDYWIEIQTYYDHLAEEAKEVVD